MHYSTNYKKNDDRYGGIKVRVFFIKELDEGAFIDLIDDAGGD